MPKLVPTKEISIEELGVFVCIELFTCIYGMIYFLFCIDFHRKIIRPSYKIPGSAALPLGLQGEKTSNDAIQGNCICGIGKDNYGFS